MHLRHRPLAVILLATLLYGCATTQPTEGPSGKPAPNALVITASLAGIGDRAPSEPESPPAAVDIQDTPKPEPIRETPREEAPKPLDPPAVPPPEPEPPAKPKPESTPKPPTPGIYLDVPKGQTSVAPGERLDIRFVSGPGRRMQLDSLRLLVDGQDKTATVRLLTRITATGLRGLSVIPEMGLKPGTRQLLVSVQDSMGQPHRLETKIVVRR